MTARKQAKLSNFFITGFFLSPWCVAKGDQEPLQLLSQYLAMQQLHSSSSLFLFCSYLPMTMRAEVS